MLMMLSKLMPITAVIALSSANNSVDEYDAIRPNNQALQDAIGKLVHAQDGLARPLTDEDGVAWRILDDAIGYLIRAEYPLRELF